MINLTGQKILRASVIIPPIRDFYFTRHRFAGLGAEIVSRILVQHGIETKIFNFPMMTKKGASLPLPPELSYLRHLIVQGEVGGASYFTSYQHFGPSLLTCAEQVLENRPEVCFFSLFAFCYSQEAIDLARLIKQRSPEMFIVFGGAGASAHPEYFIRNSFVDNVLVGEAESCLPDFIAAIVHNIMGYDESLPNVWGKRDGHIIPPSTIIHPDESKLSFAVTVTHQTRKFCYLTTALSRGCPKQCRFCSNFLCHGKEFRKVDLSNIYNELQRLSIDEKVAGKQVRVDIEDDNILVDNKYLFAAIDLFRKKYINPSFYLENGIDYLLLDDQVIDKLIDKGLSQFNISLGALDLHQAFDQDRDVDLVKYESVIMHISAKNIPVVTYFICGLPGDTQESIAWNIAYLAKKQTLIGISLFYAVPGLPDFQDLTLFDRISPRCCMGSAAWSWSQTLSTETLVTSFRLARYANLLKNQHISDDEKKLVDRIQNSRRLMTLQKDAYGRNPRIIDVPGCDEELVKIFFELMEKPAA